MEGAQPWGSGTCLSPHKLHELAHGHAGRESVRVHDFVRADAFIVEGHVFLQPQRASLGPHETILTMLQQR
jgi:hypothetical protein